MAIMGCFSSPGLKYFCSNERNWLIALNVFILLSGVSLTGFAIYLSLLVSDRTTGSGGKGERSAAALFNTCVVLAALSGLQAASATLGIVSAVKIRLYILMAYFWIQFLIALAMLLFGIGALEFQQSFSVYMRHHWSDDGMNKIRQTFCEEGTWDNKCAVPLAGYPYESREAWCIEEQGATDCSSIQARAVQAALEVVSKAMDIGGAVALMSVAEMVAAMCLTIRLVTVPIIMQSLQSIINYLMVFPVVASLLVSRFIHYNEDLYRTFGMMDSLHLFCGITLFLCAVIGALAGFMRHRRLLQIYIAIQTVVLLFYVLLVGLSFYVYGTLSSDIQALSVERAAELACNVDYYNCCCCEEDLSNIYDVPACPEWEKNEMVDLAKIFLKLGALTTILCTIFVISGLVASLMLHNNLKGYRCAYV